MKHTEDREKGGMHYSFAPDGTVLDTDRYYWVIAESFAAAALLAIRTGKDDYWESYDRLCAFADQYFVDHQYGGRFRILDENGRSIRTRRARHRRPITTRWPPAMRCLRLWPTPGAKALAGRFASPFPHAP